MSLNGLLVFQVLWALFSWSGRPVNLTYIIFNHHFPMT